jgi:hypothetical protein
MFLHLFVSHLHNDFLDLSLQILNLALEVKYLSVQVHNLLSY